MRYGLVVSVWQFRFMFFQRFTSLMFFFNWCQNLSPDLWRRNPGLSKTRIDGFGGKLHQFQSNNFLVYGEISTSGDLQNSWKLLVAVRYQWSQRTIILRHIQCNEIRLITTVHAESLHHLVLDGTGRSFILLFACFFIPGEIRFVASIVSICIEALLPQRKLLRIYLNIRRFFPPIGNSQKLREFWVSALETNYSNPNFTISSSV